MIKTTKIYLTALIILLSFNACDKSDPISSNPQLETTFNKTIEHDGLNREYILYIPGSYTGNEPVPVVFNFHGFTQQADDYMKYADFRPLADTANFILVYPQGTLFNGLSHWNVDGAWTIGSTVDDVGFTKALIDTISSEYNIDLSRVYSTGFSNGGYMSFHLACQLNDMITAIASVSATMIRTTFGDCAPQHPTPILQMHGTNDPLVPYDGSVTSISVDDALQYWINYNNCDQEPTATTLPHNDNTTNGTTVLHLSYSHGDNNTLIEHYRINNGGHDWPGSSGNMDFNACNEIWKFFSKYSN